MSTQAPGQPIAEADLRRRRMIILTSAIVLASVVTICFCTWMMFLVSRARADASGMNSPTPASAVAPVQGSLCP